MTAQPGRAALLATILKNEVLPSGMTPDLSMLGEHVEWGDDGEIMFGENAEPLPRFLVCLRDGTGEASYRTAVSVTDAEQIAGHEASDDLMPEHIVDLDERLAYQLTRTVSVKVGKSMEFPQS